MKEARPGRRCMMLTPVTTPISTRPRTRSTYSLASDIQEGLSTKRKKSTFSNKPRKSTTIGWNRLFGKYEPSKETDFSPIKATQANITHVIPKLSDRYITLYQWVINMSEQYLYDNSFLLLSSCKHNQKKMMAILRRSFIGVDMDFFNNLEDVSLLGKGAFGSVYSCRDPRTNTKFAVKALSAAFKRYTDHANNLLDYMDERNSIIRSMDCPFVVKFFYSLQIKISGALFLFFEFCIGDLINYVDTIRTEKTDQIAEMLDFNLDDFLENIHDDFPGLLEVNFLYIFEILCGLDFLVKCNIIHQDIKPDNIMVSENLHLKIGDFGLAYKTRAIHRETNKELVKVNEINTSESTNYELATPGTLYYQDFELQLLKIEGDDDKEFTNIIENKEKFDISDKDLEFSVLEPTFLTDTWALGVTAVMLLFRGFELFNPEEYKEEILPDVPRENVSLFIIHLISRKKIYKDFLENGLIKSAGENHQELMTFIASIFRPRLSRCEGYTKEKSLYHFSELVTMKYIDMDKIERIPTFANLKFNRNSIHLQTVPEDLRRIYASEKKVKFAKFKQLLDDLEVRRKRAKKPGVVVGISPGITINFFT